MNQVTIGDLLLSNLSNMKELLECESSLSNEDYHKLLLYSILDKNLDVINLVLDNLQEINYDWRHSEYGVNILYMSLLIDDEKILDLMASKVPNFLENLKGSLDLCIIQKKYNCISLLFSQPKSTFTTSFVSTTIMLTDDKIFNILLMKGNFNVNQKFQGEYLIKKLLQNEFYNTDKFKKVLYHPTYDPLLPLDDEYTTTIFSEVSENGTREILEIIVDFIIEKNMTYIFEQYHLIHRACRLQCLHLIKKICQTVTQLHVKTSVQNSPLIISSLMGDVDSVKYLLSLDRTKYNIAQPNDVTRDEDRFTALDCAIYRHRYSTVKTLVKVTLWNGDTYLRSTGISRKILKDHAKSMNNKWTYTKYTQYVYTNKSYTKEAQKMVCILLSFERDNTHQDSHTDLSMIFDFMFKDLLV